MPFESDGRWYTEYHSLGNQPNSVGLRLRVNKILHEEQSDFQHIVVFETTDFGNVLVIDDCIMLTDRDNFIYHEMMTHPALFTHRNPKNIAIIGGGDCGCLKEVLKHTQVEAVTQIDIDRSVTEVAQKFFPQLTESNTDKRAALLFEDGIKWVENVPAGSLDVLIIDSTDPVGPAEGLFTESFYRNCFNALKHDGILVLQSESAFYHLNLMKEIQQALSCAGFASIKPLFFPMITYPSGYWSATLAAKSSRVLDSFRHQDAINPPFKTTYYSEEVHQGALAQPAFYRMACDYE